MTPIDLNQAPLLDVLKLLADKGTIRQLDYQFARFIAQQASGYSQESALSQQLGFLAGVVSHELGKGHICMQLTVSDHYQSNIPADFAQLLGLYGEAALQLNQRLLSVDWPAVLNGSSLVGTNMECIKPLMFDGQRVYLQRYWNYEVVLAEALNRLSYPVEFNPEQKRALTQTLNQLFARSYHFLFNALAKANSNGQSSQVLRQQLVCDHLDVVSETELNWSEIDTSVPKSFMIYPIPSKAKEILGYPYAELIGKFSDAILKRKHPLLLVIGYSFADSHISTKIASMLANNEHSNLFIVDPKLELDTVSEKLAFSVEKDARVILLQTGFAEFNNVLKELQE